MSMLAGPRRKQKVINLRAKNNVWSNDTNKFGQRMLEKMGWSSGKGLGTKENGIVEHVVARYKNDDHGLGFEDKNDQWTKHEDDFNALLANLSNDDGKEEKLHSGISLEDKSKKSKARVHYYKFTRGKDLTRYSEKDLANIFGKKTLKNKDKIKEVLKEDVKTSEQVFTEKGSMEDYFKSKLAAFKSKSYISPSENYTNDDEGDYVFRGFSGATNEETQSEINQDQCFQGFSFNSTPVVNKVNDDNGTVIIKEELVEPKRKSKKKKKHEDATEQNSDLLNSETLNCNINELDNENGSTHSGKVKKLKKKKYENEIHEVILKKNKIAETDQDYGEHNNILDDCHVPKKKKKRKNKEIEN